MRPVLSKLFLGHIRPDGTCLRLKDAVAVVHEAALRPWIGAYFVDPGLEARGPHCPGEEESGDGGKDNIRNGDIGLGPCDADDRRKL